MWTVRLEIFHIFIGILWSLVEVQNLARTLPTDAYRLGRSDPLPSYRVVCHYVCSSSKNTTVRCVVCRSRWIFWLRWTAYALTIGAVAKNQWTMRKTECCGRTNRRRLWLTLLVFQRPCCCCSHLPCFVGGRCLFRICRKKTRERKKER